MSNSNKGDYKDKDGLVLFIKEGKISGEVTQNGVTRKVGGRFKKNCTNGSAMFTAGIFEEVQK